MDDGTSVGMLAVYAIGAAATQAELDKFHHVGKEAEATINLFQRTMELASARSTTTKVFRTTLTMTKGATVEEVEAWIQRYLYLRWIWCSCPCMKAVRMCWSFPTMRVTCTHVNGRPGT